MLSFHGKFFVLAREGGRKFWITLYNMIKTNLGHTLGGYSRRTTVNEHFAIKIPQNYPLQCAGLFFHKVLAEKNPSVSPADTGHTETPLKIGLTYNNGVLIRA